MSRLMHAGAHGVHRYSEQYGWVRGRIGACFTPDSSVASATQPSMSGGAEWYAAADSLRRGSAARARAKTFV